MAICLTLVLASVLGMSAALLHGSPWPKPQVYVTGLDTLHVTENFTFVSNLKSCEVLDKAFDRYKKTILKTTCALATENAQLERIQRVNDQSALQSVIVTVNGVCETWPSVAMIEEYSMEVNTPNIPNNAEINAASVWGAIRSLETLSQLVYVNKASQLVLNTTTILDFPRFSFRGMMLDTSRHFVPLNILLDNLDAMVQNKLNVFHWHIVDDQSFPYQSAKFPDLSEKGAFDSKHIYTFSDIAKVIDYARLRGIRVIPEFDTPGHTQSWGPGKPGLLTPCYTRGLQDGTYGPINPIVNDSYTFLKDFLAEAGKLFPEQYMHLGGDEVSFACWKSNPDILAFMQQKGFGQNFAKLEEYYEQKLIDIVSTLGKNFIVWQEVFDNKVNISKNTLIHIWKDGYHAELADVTKAGYYAILSSCWYLDDISYGIDWPKYYNCDPWDFVGSDAQKDKVIGGAACMWGEFVDGANLISRTWPRACAVAERLWSAAILTESNEAVPRLEEQRCRMLQRGLKVEPANGPGYCPCDIYF